MYQNLAENNTSIEVHCAVVMSMGVIIAMIIILAVLVHIVFPLLVSVGEPFLPNFFKESYLKLKL